MAGGRLFLEQERFGAGDGDGGGLVSAYLCNVLSQFAAYSVAWKERVRMLRKTKIPAEPEKPVEFARALRKEFCAKAWDYEQGGPHCYIVFKVF